MDHQTAPSLCAFAVQYTDRECRPCTAPEARYIDFYLPRTYPGGYRAMACVGTAYRMADNRFRCHHIDKGGEPYVTSDLRDVIHWGYTNFMPALVPA
jgi:hypothetical protein